MRSQIAAMTLAIALAGLLAGAIERPIQASEDAAAPAFFTQRVKPILDANCGRCHQGLNHRGGLAIDTREALLRGGHHGAALIPGDPAGSLLLKLIRHEGPPDDPMDMPPHKPKLSDAEIKTLEEWIRAGAVMPVPPTP